jgi:hypothetical protein
MVERAGTGEQPDLATLSGVSNALLFADAVEMESCLSFLTQAPPSETYVLAITYSSTAREWIDQWNAYAGDALARGAIVSVGQTDEEIETGTADGDDAPGRSRELILDQVWSVRTVKDSADLTGIGIEMSELLSELAEAADEGDRIVVCFDSLTALLEHAELERAFRFLHVATGRVRSGGALGYYLLDPDGHDAETLTTLQNLFDAVLEHDDDTGWTVDT